MRDGKKLLSHWIEMETRQQASERKNGKVTEKRISHTLYGHTVGIGFSSGSGPYTNIFTTQYAQRQLLPVRVTSLKFENSSGDDINFQVRFTNGLEQKFATCLQHLIDESQIEIAAVFTVFSRCHHSFFHHFSAQFLARLFSQIFENMCAFNAD